MTRVYLNQPVPGLRSYFNDDAFEVLTRLYNELKRITEADAAAGVKSLSRERQGAIIKVVRALSNSLAYPYLQVGGEPKELLVHTPGWVVVQLPKTPAQKAVVNGVYNELAKDDVADVVSSLFEKRPIPTREEALREESLNLYISVALIDSIVNTYASAQLK